MNSQGKVKIQVWLTILLVFVLGGVTGASLDRLYMSKSGSGRSGPNWRQSMMENMRKDLNLTDSQVTQIRTVFDESRKEFHPSRFAECPGVKEMRERTRQRINAILSPEQQKLYEEFEKRRERNIEQRR